MVQRHVRLAGLNDTDLLMRIWYVFIYLWYFFDLICSDIHLVCQLSTCLAPLRSPLLAQPHPVNPRFHSR